MNPISLEKDISLSHLEEAGDPMVEEALEGKPSGNGSSGSDVVS